MRRIRLRQWTGRGVAIATLAVMGGFATAADEGRRDDRTALLDRGTPGGSALRSRAADESASSARLRVLTYNIRNARLGGADSSWGGRSAGGPLVGGRREAIVKQLGELVPDVVGMQEVLPHQLDDLASRLEGYEFYSIGRRDGHSAGEACSIFWRRDRFRGEDAGTFWLSETPSAPGSRHPDAACVRIASWVRLASLQEEWLGRLTVLNTHWDHESDAARLDAADQLRRWVASQPADVPLLVLGDFNADETSPEYRRLVGSDRSLADCYRVIHPRRHAEEATFNGFRRVTEGERIDFIFRNQRLRELAATIVLPAAEAPLPSDHYPVLVDLVPDATSTPPAGPPR